MASLMPRLFCLWSDNYNLRSSLKHIYVLLYSHEVKVYQEWTAKVEDVSKTNLEKPLLIRNEQTSRLKVNFDPEVRK